MKKTTLIVPDKIEHVVGSSRSRHCASEDVTADNIVKALCDRSDYHQYFYFESSDKVEVMSLAGSYQTG